MGRAREDMASSVEEEEPSIKGAIDSGRVDDMDIVVLSTHDRRQPGRSKLAFA